jgi:hypothetical protein
MTPREAFVARASKQILVFDAAVDGSRGINYPKRTIAGH